MEMGEEREKGEREREGERIESQTLTIEKLTDEIELMVRELFTRVKDGEHEKSADILERILFKMKKAEMLSADILKMEPKRVKEIVERIKRTSSMLKILKRYYELISVIEYEANVIATKEIKSGSIVNRAT